MSAQAFNQRLTRAPAYQMSGGQSSPQMLVSRRGYTRKKADEGVQS